MIKPYVVSAAFMAILLLSCSSKQVGLKENWIDERDVIALRDGPVSQWMVKAGRPTIVELAGDTNIYYYNYRPTMYAAAVYDSTTFFKSWGNANEIKPALENATEVWGSRKNVIQIKAINEVVVSAIITEGPDKKVFVRDLYGNIVLDANTGYNSNISAEQKISSASKDFKNALNSIDGKNTWPPKEGPVVTAAEPVGQATSAEPKSAEALEKAAAAAVVEAAEARAIAEAKAKAAKAAPKMLANKANEEAAAAEAAAKAAEAKAEALAKDAAAAKAAEALAAAAAKETPSVAEPAEQAPAEHKTEAHATENHVTEPAHEPAAHNATEQ
jgi:hypothetical protein